MIHVPISNQIIKSMLKRLKVKIVSLKDIITIENIPYSNNLHDIIQQLVEFFYPTTNYGQLNVFQSGINITHDMNVGELLRNTNNEATVFLIGEVHSQEKSSTSEDHFEETNTIIPLDTLQTYTTNKTNYIKCNKKSKKQKQNLQNTFKKYLTRIIYQIYEGKNAKEIEAHNFAHKYTYEFSDDDVDENISFYMTIRLIFIFLSLIIALIISLYDSMETKFLFLRTFNSVHFTYLISSIPIIFSIYRIIRYFYSIDHEINKTIEFITTFLYILTPFWNSEKFKKKYSID